VGTIDTRWEQSTHGGNDQHTVGTIDTRWEQSTHGGNDQHTVGTIDTRWEQSTRGGGGTIGSLWLVAMVIGAQTVGLFAHPTVVDFGLWGCGWVVMVIGLW